MNYMKLGLCALTLASLSGAAWSGVGTWTTRGPHGGRVQNVVISPLSPNNLYLAAGRGGVFRSANGGGAWQRAEAGLPPALYISDLEAASAGSNVAYALSGGAGVLYRSADFGLSWFPLPAPWAGMGFPFDISVGPGNGSRVGLTTGLTTYVSDNNGSTWTISTPGSFLPNADIARIVLAANGDVYAAASYYDSAAYGLNMVRKSTDGGATWSPAGALPDLDPSPAVSPLIHYVRDFKSAPADAMRLYVVGSAIATSADAGATWSAVSLPADCDAAQVTTSPTNPLSIWISCYLSTVYRTDDASAATPVWVAMSAVGNNFTVNGSDVAQASVVALHPAYPATLHAVVGTEDGGILRSTNNGGLWLPQNSGYESSNMRALAVNPLDASMVLAGYGDAFTTAVPLSRSEDSGVSWVRSDAGMNAEQVRALAIDPTTVDANPLTTENFHVYAAGRAAPIPDGAAIDGGIYKSTTSGNAWTTIDSGIALRTFYSSLGPVMRPFMGTVRSVVLDPRSCDVPPVGGPCPAVVPPTGASTLKTVFVGGSGVLGRSLPVLMCPDVVQSARIYKSINAGASWVPSDTGISIGQDLNPGTPGEKCAQIGGVVPVVVDPVNPNNLYAGTFLAISDWAFPTEPTLPNGVFKSNNGGATWVHSSTGLPRVGGPASSHWDVLSIAINPANPDTLYATAIDFSGTHTGRVYRSSDAGASWIQADSGIAGADVRALLVDPNDPTGNTVYAGAGGAAANPGGVYRTTDGGLTWNSYSIGLLADAALALAIPPRPTGAPFRLFAGTIAGVWEFTEPEDPDGDGAPSVIESASPGPLLIGDGNGDGVPDAGQASVASNAGTVFGIPAGAGLVGEAGASNVSFTIAIEGGSCSQINNSQLVEPALLPIDPRSAEISYPYGVVRIELPSCGQATIDASYHGAAFNDSDWSWRNYGPSVPGDDTTFGWYALGSRVTRLDANTWRLTLDAGQFGVYRPSSDNILTLGGPAFLPAELFADSFE